MTQQQPTPIKQPTIPVTNRMSLANSTRMSLANSTRGKIKRSMRVFLYGVDKIGKTTFAAGAPAPYFIGAEDGTAELDVERSPEPRSFADINCILDQLINDDHPHKSVVLDTLDWAEPMIWRATCERGDEKTGKKPKSIEGFGFGKGYTEALTEWRALLTRLDALRLKRKMHIILLAHAHIKTYKNPEGDDYDRFAPKIHERAAALIKEWADAILFAKHETSTVVKGEGAFAKARGIGTGARYIYTQRTAAYDAGNRYGLPPRLPLNWDDFDAAVRAGTPEDPVRLAALITVLLGQVDAETRGKAEAWMAAGDNATNPIKLSQLADRLRGKLTIINDNAEQDSKEEHTQS